MKSGDEAAARDAPLAEVPPIAEEDSVRPERTDRERIGRYELCFELAAGGMATVYLARVDGVSGFEKLVALKRIHPHLAKEKRYVDMFLDEAKIASRITHSNVCSVFDFGHADGEYFIAMEYLLGEPLSRLCGKVARSREQRRHPLLPLRMARIVADACEGLHAAHELKDANGDLLRVVHRDVSPRNLFVTYDGSVQVVDFGIASARQRMHHTATGQVKGTFAYMSPEQLTASSIDRRVDIWSLGVALWEMLTLRRLFRRDTTANTVHAVLYDELAPPSKYRSQVPEELDAIVMRALERDPNERWQTARELGRALRKYIGAQPEVMGAAELSEWMGELFPEGEARKSQLMEVARMSHDTVPAVPRAGENDVTLTATGFQTEELTHPSKPPWRSRPALALLALLGALLLVAALASGLSDSEPPLEEGPPASVSTSPAPSPPPVPDAVREAVPVAPRADVPDAKPPEPTNPIGVDEETKKPTDAVAPKPRRTKTTAKAATGTINLVTRGGWAEVYKGRKLLGSTPRRLTLPAGRHRLLLKPFGEGKPKRIVVHVTANETKKVSVRLE